MKFHKSYFCWNFHRYSGSKKINSLVNLLLQIRLLIKYLKFVRSRPQVRATFENSSNRNLLIRDFSMNIHFFETKVSLSVKKCNIFFPWSYKQNTKSDYLNTELSCFVYFSLGILCVFKNKDILRIARPVTAFTFLDHSWFLSIYFWISDHSWTLARRNSFLQRYFATIVRKYTYYNCSSASFEATNRMSGTL